MKSVVFRSLIVIGLVVTGWSVGRAQVSQPDFEFVVDAPVGETTVTCTRGCDLEWIGRGVHSGTKPVPVFTFKCGGMGATRCSSYTVGGWIKH